ncbi:MAG: nicotinate phosphoribosyltransferase, partial [Acutalibacteraceae bacterium]|nr:nicotinate phosphoribosyltransferase [Acutalibacteraceae bacterium]
ENPTVKEIAENCKNQVDSRWDEVTRFEKPHAYYVDLSEELWDLRYSLLDKLAHKGE